MCSLQAIPVLASTRTREIAWLFAGSWWVLTRKLLVKICVLEQMKSISLPGSIDLTNSEMNFSGMNA